MTTRMTTRDQTLSAEKSDAAVARQVDRALASDGTASDGALVRLLSSPQLGAVVRATAALPRADLDVLALLVDHALSAADAQTRQDAVRAVATRPDPRLVQQITDHLACEADPEVVHAIRQVCEAQIMHELHSNKRDTGSDTWAHTSRTDRFYLHSTDDLTTFVHAVMVHATEHGKAFIHDADDGRLLSVISIPIVDLPVLDE